MLHSSSEPKGVHRDMFCASKIVLDLAKGNPWTSSMAVGGICMWRVRLWARACFQREFPDVRIKRESLRMENEEHHD